MAKSSINWISEEQATQKLGYTKESLRLFTRNERMKKLPIRTTKINAKTILYSMTDIEEYINSKQLA
jgi:hypothetical protein